MSDKPLSAGAALKIRSALFELLKIKYYKDISVSELAKAAGVSRQAFYMHYPDKDAILISQFRSFFNTIINSVRSQNISTVDELVSVYTDIVGSNVEYLKLLAKNNLGGMLGNTLVEMFVNQPPVLPTQRISRSENENRYINSFWIHAFIQVYTLWINEDLQTAPEEIRRILTDIMKGNYFVS